jgi:hypothetical protein
MKYKKTLLALVVALSLTGCGYYYNEVQAARAACDTYRGEFSLITTGERITSTRCKVDGVTYRIGRTQYELLEGQK